ncbi:hypothetical protein KEM55_003747 [Ascosphaera atra]|nr:hypothetical protein KEM55_003747 [Ascosphaera atra]
MKSSPEVFKTWPLSASRLYLQSLQPAQPAQPTEPSTPKSLKRDITKTEEDESPTSVEGTPTPTPQKKLQRTKAATKHNNESFII